MNTIQLRPTGARLDAPERCEVAVVYDDVASRVRAIHLSENLASRFEGDLDFNFTWWNVRFLKDPQISSLAEEAVAEADLVLFSISQAAEPAPALKDWIKRWLSRRQSDEGALAVLLDQSTASKDQITPLESYLRKVAEGGHMDFLPRMMPAATATSSRHSPRDPRTDKKSLGDNPRPLSQENSHWGINE
jgi:hypothetical protein